VYPLLGTGDIVRRAQAAVRMKARHFGIVTSGRSLPAGELENVCEAIRAVREMGNPIPCASLGALERGTAATLRDAGLRRYHHNLETSARFFPLVCTTHTWEDRLRTVTAARDAGLEICSGGIFGLGESWGDRVDLGIALRDEGAHSVPLNFLMPIKGTPMEDREPLAASEALRVIALFRFLLPRAEIRVAGGRESVLGGMQPMILHAGADGMMVGDYLTMKGRPPEEDLRMIEQLGLDIG
jgi:biotin synthase